jgi:DNA-binding NarL/FixJ family response regulator
VRKQLGDTLTSGADPDVAPKLRFGQAYMAIKVLIADDHGVVAKGLQYLVDAQADMKVIACAQDGREAVHRSIETSPDIVLMDNAMPVLNGIEATRMICERQPQTRVTMLSMYSDPVHVYRALQAGATGYVVKKSVAKEVIDAIRVVHSGRRYLSKSLADDVIDQFLGKGAAEDPLECLSSRERQVLQLLADGLSVHDIAFKLSLSPKTVETYRARMMEKVGIHNLAGLIKLAIQQGIVSLD